MFLLVCSYCWVRVLLLLKSVGRFGFSVMCVVLVRVVKLSMIFGCCLLV